MKLCTLLSGILLAVVLQGCASDPGPEHHYHSSTIVNDMFPVEQGMPVREVKKDQTFFFRKCDRSSRPFFTKTEYECSDVR